MYVCVPQTFPVPKEARRGHQLPWNWSSKGLWPITWVLGAELQSPGRATSALTCGDIPPISRPCIWKMFWIGPVMLPFQLQNRACWEREGGMWKEMMKTEKTHFHFHPTHREENGPEPEGRQCGPHPGVSWLRASCGREAWRWVRKPPLEV